MAPNSPPSSRRPLPQPIEETKRSSRAGSSKEGAHEGNTSKSRRPLPQPVETSSKSSKKSSKENRDGSEMPHESASSVSVSPPPLSHSIESSTATSTPKPKKFAPQMVETSRRSRRNTDTSGSVTPTDHTYSPLGKQDYLPKHMRPTALPLPPDNSPLTSVDQVPQVPESRFSSAKLAAKTPKRHSFRVPDLPAIPSLSEATESELSDSAHSPGSDSKDSGRITKTKRRRRRKRHSSEPKPGQETGFSGYLLSLAARAAEKQLRDQAMAAYPNEHLHEPVDHYAIDSESEDSEVGEGVGKLSMEDYDEEETEKRRRSNRRSHRESSAGFDLAEMRQHQKNLDDQRRAAWAAEGEAEQTGRRKSMHNAPRENQAGGAPPQEIVGWQKDNEIKSMRNAASPPMAGANLKFPRCQSPRHTRLDVYHYPGGRKPTEKTSQGHSGLWTPGGSHSRRSSQTGLWMGVNHASAQPDHAKFQAIETGLLTPAGERSDPFDSSTPKLSPTISNKTSYLAPSSLPPSPPPCQEEIGFDNPLGDEPLPINLDEEFNDAFITQVYNYLSLGYPSLARPYDEEFAKITQMSLDVLRKDDENGNSKGYIGAPEGTGPDLRGCREGACQRWLALRIYVKEWGKHQLRVRGLDGMTGWKKEGLGNEGWGAAARKGSWAI